MIHAREDYNRFQEPGQIKAAALELLDKIEFGLEIEPDELDPLRSLVAAIPDVSDGSTPIADDEPVFLMRAQDELFPDMVEEYGRRALAKGRTATAQAALEQAITGRKWQDRHGSKLPDLPGGNP